MNDFPKLIWMIVFAVGAYLKTPLEFLLPGSLLIRALSSLDQKNFADEGFFTSLIFFGTRYLFGDEIGFFLSCLAFFFAQNRTYRNENSSVSRLEILNAMGAFFLLGFAIIPEIWSMVLVFALGFFVYFLKNQHKRVASAWVLMGLGFYLGTPGLAMIAVLLLFLDSEERGAFDQALFSLSVFLVLVGFQTLFLESRLDFGIGVLLYYFLQTRIPKKTLKPSYEVYAFFVVVSLLCLLLVQGVLSPLEVLVKKKVYSGIGQDKFSFFPALFTFLSAIVGVVLGLIWNRFFGEKSVIAQKIRQQVYLISLFQANEERSNALLSGRFLRNFFRMRRAKIKWSRMIRKNGKFFRLPLNSTGVLGGFVLLILFFSVWRNYV